MQPKFGRMPGFSAKRVIRVGVPCKNCEHSHMDHSYQGGKNCLIDKCKCKGLEIDVVINL